jgi:hypothetical protein
MPDLFFAKNTTKSFSMTIGPSRQDKLVIESG